MPIDPNVEALISVAAALGDMLDEVVFVGGATVGLLMTDPAAPAIRQTDDVDCVIEATSRADYDTRIRAALIERGFAEMQGEGIPLCAWTRQGIRLDVMPTQEAVLGFSNRWYDRVLEMPLTVMLEGLTIRLAPAPLFVATKLVAFRSRGKDDFLRSHDIEDIIAVVDGRPELVIETGEQHEDVRAFLSAELGGYLKNRDFVQSIPGHVVDSGREGIVISRLQKIAATQPH